MATKKADSSKSDVEAVTSATIADQVAAFLKSGNAIEEVPQGVSGMPDKPSRHIVISRK